MGFKIDNNIDFKKEIKHLGFIYEETINEEDFSYEDWYCESCEPLLTIFINYTKNEVTVDVEIDGWELKNINSLEKLKILHGFLKID